MVERKQRNPVELQNGERYDSVAAFCLAYGLKYVSVWRQLKRGKSPDEVLSLLGQLPTVARYKDSSRAAVKCSYDGVVYPSISIASEVLGVSAQRVYYYRNHHNMTADEALARVVNETDIKNDVSEQEREDRARACVVDGVVYPTKAEALRAYGLHYQTVKSRMIREGITFEEAIRRGKDDRRKHVQITSKWGRVHASTNEPDGDSIIMAQIERILEQCGYKTHKWADEQNNVGVVYFFEKLQAFRDPKVIYLLFPYRIGTNVSTDIELVMPELILLDDGERLINTELLRLINSLNTELLGVKIACVGDRVQANWSVAVPCSEKVNIRTIVRAIHSFVAGSGIAYEAMKGYERDGEEEP